MILRETFINKIRKLGYKLQTETKRVHIWRKKGTQHYITVRKTDRLEEVFVASSLKQAGLSITEIHTFIGQHTVGS